MQRRHGGAELAVGYPAYWGGTRLITRNAMDACPLDDPLCIAVWYTMGRSIVTLVGRGVSIWLSRW
jgi:hypothetical protein